MTIEIKQRLLPDGSPNKPSCPMQPRHITIHNTDNTAPGATAESHARYILNGSGGREVSWHYTVDDHEIYQHLRDNEQGWYAGDSDGLGNTTSIGIEVCRGNNQTGQKTAPVTVLVASSLLSNRA